MRTNIFNVLMFLALSAVVSCHKEELNNEENNSSRMSDIILRAEIDNEEADKGKTHLEMANGDNYSVVWDALDKIVIIDASNQSALYKVIGQGGSTSTSFEKESGEIGENNTPYKAYSPSTLVDNNQLVWPSEQSYVAEQESTTRLQGVSNAPMFAENTGTLKDIFMFKNIGGLLRLTLKGGDGAKVKSIKVSTNNGEKLSGPFTIEYAQDDSGHNYPKAVIDPIKGKNSIVLNMPNDGVTLNGGTDGVKFYFAVAARTYHDLTFEVSTDKGVMRMTAKRADGASGIEATRSSIITLPKTVQPSDWKQEFEWIDLGLPSGKLWANMNIGATSETDYGDYYFWGETEPWFSYDLTSYKVTWINGHTQAPKTDYSDLNMKKIQSDLVGEYKKHDVAFINTGGIGYCPSKADWEELKSYTTYELKHNIEGKNYLKFTGSNGNSILLPYAGRFDTSKNEGGKSIYEPDGYAEYQTSTNYPSSSQGYQYYASETGGSDWSLTSGGYYRYRVAVPVRAVKNPDPVVPADVKYIDLGVEVDGKKILWADRNIGANNPESSGYYIAWGASELPYTALSGSKFTFKSKRPEQYGSISDTNNWPSDDRLGFTTNCAPFHFYKNKTWSYEKYNGLDKTILDPEDDLAARTWGHGWRTPTVDEFRALAAQCVLKADNNKYGYYVFKAKNDEDKGKIYNGNGYVMTLNKTTFNYESGGSITGTYDPSKDLCIYLPQANHATKLEVSGTFTLYWTSSLNLTGSIGNYNVDYAWSYYVNATQPYAGSTTQNSSKERYYGGVVRPVFVVE